MLLKQNNNNKINSDLFRIISMHTYRDRHGIISNTYDKKFFGKKVDG